MSLNPLDDTQLSVLQIVQTLLQGQDKSTITLAFCANILTWFVR